MHNKIFNSNEWEGMSKPLTGPTYHAADPN